MAVEPEAPRLRPVEAHAHWHEGRPVLLLRDPLRLSRQPVIVPRALAPVLALCDGTRAGTALEAEAEQRFGLRYGSGTIEHLLETLDQALLLDNTRARAAEAAALAAYRTAPFRPPAMAGRAYPAEPAALEALLDGYLRESAGEVPALPAGRGLFSPHIDFARGGAVYAQVWQAASALAQAAECVIVFGTDHYAGEGRVTLTRQDYATPYGRLPTDRAVVDALAAALGEEAAFGGELRHRDEHAIELVLVWLQHLRRGRPCPVIPILVGGFAHFVEGPARPAAEAGYARLVEALRLATAGRNALVLVSGDLSHVGPAFGGEPVDPDGAEAIGAFDDRVLERLCAGDAEGFFETIRAAGDQSNICGLPPAYLALRLLGPGTRGRRAGYARCPAEPGFRSLVSVGGVVWE